MAPFVELLKHVQDKSGATLAPIITSSSEKAKQLLPSATSPVLVSIRRRSSASLNLNTRVSKVLVTILATISALLFVLLVHKCVLPRPYEAFDPEGASYGAYASAANVDLELLRDLPQQHMPQPAGANGTPERKAVIVGDVHACADELMILLNETAFVPNHDTLLLTGDLLSKGPAPLRTLALLRSLNATAVRGNHDDRLLAELPAAHPNAPTGTRPRNGLSDADIAWLTSMPALLRLRRPDTSATTLIAHAGVLPGIPPEAQAARDALALRTVAPRRRGWGFRRTAWMADAGPRARPWYEVWEEEQARAARAAARTRADDAVAGPVRVVYGHDSAADVQEWRWSVGLNTGCVRGGSLTGLVMHGDGAEELVQVECRRYEG